MAMQQIEPVIEHDLVHAHSERQVVRWILEERISSNVHFVKEDARQKCREAKRLLVRDEVDLMPATRQRDAELRGQRAGSTIRRVTGDTNLHAPTPCSEPRRAHRATVSCQSADSGSILVTRATGSWCRNHVRCRFA